MAEVRLDGVAKHFKDTVAVAEVSLTINDGEFFSLLGPSGCGKTTTLRMIGGFEEPTRGRVFLGNDDVTDVAPYKRNVNTVFQSYALFPHLDVFENVAFGLRRKKVADDEITTRVDEMLHLVRMDGYEKRRIDQMSGGQQQRVALARALVNQPALLLLDEPLGALDLKLRHQMQLELKRIQQDVGITFIYVTHDQEEAMTMSDRIGVMNEGRLEQVGPPRDVYELPATPFVAGFLGASNLLEGHMEEARDGYVRVSLVTGESVSVPVERLPEGASGAISVGVRPEKLHVRREHTGGDAAGANQLAARVVESSYTGVSTSYRLETKSGAVLVAYVQNLDGGVIDLKQGEPVALSWAPEQTFVVRQDSEGGKR